MISVRNLTKVFRIPHERKKTLFHNITSIIKKSYDYDELYALRNVSFDIECGEFVGIIGRNGSGKSTLLKVLSKIYRPSAGEIYIQGEVLPLLELGVGFQPDFTVRDNIYIYGSLIGFSRREMKKRLEVVLNFSELHQFVDVKLDKLSTGMKVRLAFAIAIQGNAPIFLIDEVLAVGDYLFQMKCKEKFHQYKKEKKTIIFVTHDMNLIQEYCTRVFVIERGEIVNSGLPSDMVKYYKSDILGISPS